MSEDPQDVLNDIISLMNKKSGVVLECNGTHVVGMKEYSQIMRFGHVVCARCDLQIGKSEVENAEVIVDASTRKVIIKLPTGENECLHNSVGAGRCFNCGQYVVEMNP